MDPLGDDVDDLYDLYDDDNDTKEYVACFNL